MLATWHALAKLQMHISSSLSFFDGVTKTLGQLLQRFNDHVCSKYNTLETPAEYAKKAHQKAAKQQKARTLMPSPVLMQNLNAVAELLTSQPTKFMPLVTMPHGYSDLEPLTLIQHRQWVQWIFASNSQN